MQQGTDHADGETLATGAQSDPRAARLPRLWRSRETMLPVRERRKSILGRHELMWRVTVLDPPVMELSPAGTANELASAAPGRGRRRKVFLDV